MKIVPSVIIFLSDDIFAASVCSMLVFWPTWRAVAVGYSEEQEDHPGEPGPPRDTGQEDLQTER
jgi:hypothetical protein